MSTVHKRSTIQIYVYMSILYSVQNGSLYFSVPAYYGIDVDIFRARREFTIYGYLFLTFASLLAEFLSVIEQPHF
jgi:hypothetical protein